MAGDSLLVPAGAVVDDAGDAMLVMPLSPCVVMRDAAQTPLWLDSLLLDRAILRHDDKIPVTAHPRSGAMSRDNPRVHRPA